MSREYTNQTKVLVAAAANGASAAVNMEAFKNIELELAQTGFTGTVKFVGSNADTAPDFGAAATSTNPWDYVKCINLIDGAAVNGGTGLTGAATTSVTQLEVNTNGMKWIGAIISGFAAGTVDLRAKGYTGT